MELHTFAYTVGILELLMGLPLLFYPKKMMKWMQHFMKQDPLMRVIGALMTVLAALVLIEDYRVGSDVEGIVRFIAWLIFLKGILWTWWPDTALKLKKKWLKSDALITLGGICAVGFAVAMVYAGMLL